MANNTNNRLFRLFEEGEERLIEEMNVERMIKHIRDMRIFIYQ